MTDEAVSGWKYEIHVSKNMYESQCFNIMLIMFDWIFLFISAVGLLNE